MGVKADLDEVVTAWPKYPWPLRLWLLLSVFIASGAIASLSETVFKWKGFLLDALTFYRTVLSEPLATLIRSQNAKLGPDIADALVLAAVSTVAQLIVSGEQNEPPASRLRRELRLGVFLLLYLSIGGHLQSPNLNLELLLVWWWIAVLSWQFIQYVRIRGNARLLGLSSLILPFALLAIAAAINAGLTRTQ